MRKLVTGVNDLATTNPELVNEWDFENNNGMMPDQFTAGSGKNIHWICKKCGYRWISRIADRTRSNTGCPCCANRVVVKGVNDLASLRPDLVEEWDYDNNDGRMPDQFTLGSGVKANWICKTCGYRWASKIVNRAKAGSRCPCCANRVAVKGVNDLASLRPDLVEEWDFENNNGMMPDQFPVGSVKKVKWVCKECGYRWISAIASRTSQGSGCPSCKNSRLVPGKNDLASQRPELIEEWDFEQNRYAPNQVRFSSHVAAHWKCAKCGHKWMARVEARSIGNGCPNCSGRVLVPGKNDLASQSPELAIDWDYFKNDLKPYEVFRSSNLKFHWKCHICGHSWYASPNSRLKRPRCPACSGKTLIEGKNDLASQRPELAKDWDYEKNNKTPQQIFVFSNQQAYWQCHICGYAWCANIENRSNGAGCPACSKQVLIPGENDLASQRPHLCNEWDFERNKATPDEVLVFSHILAHWKCAQCGHEWRARVEERSLGTGCPKCFRTYIPNVRRVI